MVAFGGRVTESRGAAPGTTASGRCATRASTSLECTVGPMRFQNLRRGCSRVKHGMTQCISKRDV